MLLDAKTVLLVGGAMLAPTMLNFETPTPPTDTGLIPGDPRTVLEGHRTAAAFFRSTAVLGVTTTASSVAGLVLQNRFAEVMRALIPTHGATLTSPGFAKLSVAEVTELVRVTLETARIGINEATPDDGYVFSRETSLFGGDADFVPQTAPFEELLTLAQGGVPTDFTSPNSLAEAVGEVVKQRFLATTVGAGQGAAFDSTAAVRAVNVMLGAMDNQGVNFDGPGLGDLADSIADSAADLPGRITSVVSSVVGDAVGAILFSRPVLLGAAAYLVYRAVRS